MSLRTQNSVDERDQSEVQGKLLTNSSVEYNLWSQIYYFQQHINFL